MDLDALGGAPVGVTTDDLRKTVQEIEREVSELRTQLGTELEHQGRQEISVELMRRVRDASLGVLTRYDGDGCH